MGVPLPERTTYNSAEYFPKKSLTFSINLTKKTRGIISSFSWKTTIDTKEVKMATPAILYSWTAISNHGFYCWHMVR